MMMHTRGHETSYTHNSLHILVCLIILSFLVSLFLKVSSFKIMEVSASYAAILSVFVSNVPASTGC